ncbi:hypothetical protein L1049_018691 [Liquidambar formosana]|uniref:EF-hand domain-containing protein n=1 Tax=Liquidambar formosana TaxID=63359 RepID=A0AAP0WMK5_LIQFO
MAKQEPSDSESEENSSSEELETSTHGSNQVVSEYEEQRLRRIRENKARMVALGLHESASRLMGSVGKQNKGKGKAKVVEKDEEYRPPDGDEERSSSSSGEDDDDDDFVGGGGSGSRARKVNSKNSKSKKKVSIQKLLNKSNVIDDDDALLQAISLSLEDSAGVTDMVHSRPSQGSDEVTHAALSERKGNARIQEDTGRRKRKKMSSSRVQMTEDELIIHFFQFDEAGKGGIALRDLKRVANAHDFTWTDKEMANMIRCFDSNGDGKLSLDDFREIVVRCNMIQRSENDAMGSKS